MDNLFGLSPQNVQSLRTLMLVLGAREDMLCKWVEACQRATFPNLKLAKVLAGDTFNVLSSSVELIHNQILKHHTDNKNVERVLSVGSKTPELQKLVVDIFQLCIQHNIQLVLE